ncbi:MAG: YbjN domain-containing protein [Bacteroidota bacterium]
MADLQKCYALVEDCIQTLGVDPSVCRGGNPGQWELKKGSASVWIDVWQNDDDWGYLMIMAPICNIPDENKEEFLTEILEINHKLYGCAMTKYENTIYVKTVREVEGLSKDEAMAMFNRVGNYSDEYDDYLQQKYFGGGRAE